MTTDEMIRAMYLQVCMLTKEHKPQITFAEIQANLGLSRQGTSLWITRHKLRRVGKGRYHRVEFTEAATCKAV